MKPRQKRYILRQAGEKSVRQLARELDLPEEDVRRVWERRGPAAESRSAGAPGSPFERKKQYLAVALIVLLGFAVYANSLKGLFLWDDYHLVQENRFIRGWSNIGDVFAKDVGAGAENNYSFYRPLQILSYMLDYAFWKTAPVGYHLGNIVYHVLSALLVFWLISLLFADFLLALLTALFFVLHPIHTEAVTYISGRADPLSTAFVLAAMIYYTKASRTPRLLFFVLALVSYACALLSRENVLIAPFLLLLYHYVFRQQVNRKFFLSFAGLAALYILLRFTWLRFIIARTAHTTMLGDRLPGFFAAVAAYLKILVLPVHLHMEYGSGLFSLFHPQVIAGLLVFSFASYWLVKERNRRSLVFFAICWFFLGLLPVSNLYPVNAFMAEHWLYLPSIGFFLLAAKLFVTFLRREKTKGLCRCLLVALLAVLGALTIRQNETWLNPISFFTRLLLYVPDGARVHNALGLEYNRVKDYDKGAAHLEKAVALLGTSRSREAKKAFNNLSLVYNNIGKSDEAAAAAAKSVAIDGTNAKAYNNLAISYINIGKYEQAAEACRKALEIKPDYAKAYNTLGAILLHGGKTEDALEAYGKAVELAPDYPEANNNLGLAYQAAGDIARAAEYYEKAVKLRPDYVNAHFNLANAYVHEGRVEEAAAAYKRTVALDPKHGGAYLDLAALYFKKGEYALAVENADRAQRLGMSHPEFSEKLAPYREQ